jgi:hypothetical protein
MITRNSILARLGSVETAALIRSRGGLSNIAVTQMPLSFSMPPSQILCNLPVGALVFFGGLLINAPFNNAATLSLGTSADLGAVLGVSDSVLHTLGQYESDLMIPVTVADVLVLTLGGAPTQGAGLLLYSLVI